MDLETRCPNKTWPFGALKPSRHVILRPRSPRVIKAVAHTANTGSLLDFTRRSIWDPAVGREGREPRQPGTVE